MQKKHLAIASFVVGIIGFGIYFIPILEILFGIAAIVLAIMAKDPNLHKGLRFLRARGLDLGILNLLWVAVELFYFKHPII